jgi:hypothetical protein
MKTPIAHLHIPPKWRDEPPEIERDYPSRTFDFDTAERAASGLAHRSLFVAVGKARKQNRCDWFRCACRDDLTLEVMVRLREPSPYLAVMPNTSLEHDPDCAFHRVPITSHVSDAVKVHDDGSLSVRLNFRVGLPVPEPEKTEILNEAPLRTRQVQQQLNRFGLEGLLRLLFSEAGLHRWRPWYRPQDRVTAAGSWKPTYTRLLQTLGRIEARGRRHGTLKDYTRIGVPAPYDPGTVIAWVDVIEKVEPPENGYYWKCHVAGWTGKRNYLLISPAQVELLLGQLRFHPDRVKTTLAQKLTIEARPGEVWWGCLLVRIEKGDNGKWCRVLDQGVLRTDRRGIPAESLDEIAMTQYLVEAGRSFCKPLLAGELEAVSWRRPDFILEDTAQPCCIEVAGMADVYDYNDRDDERLGDYDQAQVKYKRWKRGDRPLDLDGPFRAR